MNNRDFYSHPTADIEPGAVIGAGTRIWNNSHIMKGAKIGANCNLGQNVFVGSTAIVGNNVKVQNNVSIYDEVVIEDDCFLGPSMVFTNVINPRAFIERKDEYKKTIVKKGASIGANATIVCGVTLGEYSFIGAGSVVTRDVGAFQLVYGNPAKFNAYVCICGNKILFDEDTGICSCSKRYRMISGEGICYAGE